ILAGELLLPAGTVSLTARVRVRLAENDDASGTDPGSLGCEITGMAATDRNQLELFLFGSDLQWQLNGLADRVQTPLERLGSLLAGSRQQRPAPARHWWPLLCEDLPSRAAR